ncbi:MAG TPA: aldehyde dehydrogenase family protein [Egibacteraceae bacterium]|nr:aldehyde dehydrogenase family protein [Egibacteraceae bacterium]
MEVPLIIGGQEVQEASGGETKIIDPSTGDVLGTAVLAGEEEAARAAEQARAHFDAGSWRRMKPFERGRVLLRVGDALMRDRDELARLESLESGKPLRDAYWEVDCSARFFEFYGGYVDKIQGSSVPLGPGFMDWTVREPIGVSLHIVPWNYPLQVAVRGVAPALAAGCTVIIKPATETPASAYRLARIAEGAGLPQGTLSVVTGEGRTVGDALARHRAVDQITFTGSVPTGQKVLEAAASHTIPTIMELGGKSAQIVYPDADLDRILPILNQGMYLHAGQVCNAGTRLVIHEAVEDRVVEELHGLIRQMRLGHALDDPDMGPVISQEQKANVEEYLDIAESEGGRVLIGADLPDEPRLANGYFARPALVTNITNDARVAQEEIFGPILSVIGYTDEDEAIRIANQSPFGLVAGVFTSSIDRAMYASQELRVGQVWVNSFGVGLDVEFPFGGYKASGFGREKGLEALNAYLQVKNTCVAF